MTLLPAKNYPINCGTATTFNNPFSKRLISDRKFDIITSAIQRVISNGGNSLITLDKNGTEIGTPLKIFSRQSGATYVTDYIVDINVRDDGYFQKITISSNSPNILSNPNTITNISSYQSDGSCIFVAESEDGETALIKLQSSLISPATVDTFYSWANGSLAKHCVDQINGLIINKTQLNVFNQTSWFTPPDFVRNTNCWANGIDLSCASPWNNEAGSLFAGTLISPRHVAFCEHASFYPQNGKTITFVSPLGNPVTRTIINSVRVNGADIRIALLDSNVSNDITYAKVLPTSWSNYIVGLNFTCTIPVLCLNQTERASIAALYALNLYFYNSYPNSYPNYYGDIIRFDSGNPTFLIINNEPVLLGVFTTGGAGAGSFISYHTNSVNSAMSELGGGYQLTAINLSQFNNYGT